MKGQLRRSSKRRWSVIIAAIVLVMALVFSSCGKNSKYEKLFDEGQEQYLAGEYEKAIKSLEKAVEIKATEEAYLLLSDVYYYGLDDIESAIETLYNGSVKISGKELSKRLEELKAEKSENYSGKITIGAKEFDAATLSVILSDMELKDEDLTQLSLFKQIESLTINNNFITDLGPVGELEYLTSLFAADNRIEDLSPISGLTRLRTLYLDGNPIKDFSPLYKLTNLNTLSIKNIQIDPEELKALKDAMPWCNIFCDNDDEIVEISLGGVTFMSDVEQLNLGGLGITDISVLEKCTKLKTLDLRNNDIKDISALSSMTELTWLCLWGNDITDIMPLVTLSKLEYLDLDENDIDSAAGLVALSSLQELWISGNKLDDLTALGYLGSIRRLGLKDNDLGDEDLDVLMKLITLEELKLEENESITAEKLDELKEALPNCAISHSEVYYTVTFGGTTYTSKAVEIDAANRGITDISGLEKFTQLTALRLGGNMIEDITPLAGLTRLETLDLSCNGISDISALADMKKLKQLDLSDNVLSSIKTVGSCTELQKLCIDNNPVMDIGALASLSHLTEFSAANCGISDLSPLASLWNLNTLHLEGNNISDLYQLRNLQSLRKLYIGENDLTAEQIKELRKSLPYCEIFTDIALD